LAAGAEATVTSFLAQKFTGKRVIMREETVQAAIRAIEKRVGRELRGADRRNARRIVDASGEALRAARRATGSEGGTFDTRGIPAAPGRARGDDQLSWYVVVVSTDTVTGEQVRVPMDIRTGDGAAPDQVVAKALDRMSSGQFNASYRNKVEGLKNNKVSHVEIVSVYRGFPRVT
jgi:hypothetical protein